MKPKILIVDPNHLRTAGLSGILDACVLTHIGRCGLQGARIPDMSGSLRINISTLHTVMDRLVELKLITRSSQSNARGRANLWVVTVAGWELLTRTPDLSMFPDSLTALPERRRK
jgi:DNA-binding MarR family transcriptional regulator